MKSKVKLLLAADALINLILGALLLLFPAGILEYLGLPSTNTYFYSSILGGVIFGIGVALGLECWRGGKGLSGLGLAGAISINLFGGGTLLFWLLFVKLEIPLRGTITLWIVAILVVGIGLVELFSKSWQEE
jgi:hypothetical protein